MYNSYLQCVQTPISTPQQIDASENDLDMQMVFAIDEAAELLLETGFRKPLMSLGLSDKKRVQEVLLGFHCVLKVKGEMDQFRQGLSSLGVLQALNNNASTMKSLFVSPSCKITAGKCV